MLQYVGRLARLSADRVRSLLSRIRSSRQVREPLRLSGEDVRLLQQVEAAFREFEGHVATTGVTPIRRPTARGFIFSNPFQPQVLGRLLGRLLTSAAQPVRAGLREADGVATGICARLVAHWDAARPRRGTDDELRRVFRDLKLASPPNPNTWVRERLYTLWRRRAMNRIYRDVALRRALREQAGIIVGRNPRTRTISFHVRTQSASRGRTQTAIDFDHAQIRHADAVSRALRTDDYRQLLSTVDPNNIQLMTARENRNFIEAIREAAREMEGP
jgi:hypothetical protein